jgi:hypothetical protein
VNATFTPIGDCGPYSARTTSPATIVGSANGRSMIPFTSDLPRKSSRTRTDAVIVPSTAFVSAAIAATVSVSFSAATASGPFTTSQKPAPPACVDDQISAAIGSPTITER